MSDPNIQDCINDSHEKRIKELERDMGNAIAWVKLADKKIAELERRLDKATKVKAA